MTSPDTLTVVTAAPTSAESCATPTSSKTSARFEDDGVVGERGDLDLEPGRLDGPSSYRNVSTWSARMTVTPSPETTPPARPGGVDSAHACIRVGEAAPGIDDGDPGDRLHVGGGTRHRHRGSDQGGRVRESRSAHRRDRGRTERRSGRAGRSQPPSLRSSPGRSDLPRDRCRRILRRHFHSDPPDVRGPG